MPPVALSKKRRRPISGIARGRLFASSFVSFAICNQQTAGRFVHYGCLLFFPARVAGGERESHSAPLHRGGAGRGDADEIFGAFGGATFPRRLEFAAAGTKKLSPRDWLQSVGVIVLACLVVCGWNYGRVWAQSGNPIIGNWQIKEFSWWQDPGFRTSSYYLGFGQILVAPLFSGFHGFADGLCSTLWGDGAHKRCVSIAISTALEL